jgi:cytidylate kinase
MNIITISRGSLSATEMLATKISQKLNYSIVTREDVIHAAEKYGIMETGLGSLSFIEKSPTFWDKMSDRKKHYLSCFQTALLDFALEGSIVYHGHLAQFLLSKIPFVLRILLTAPMEFRVKTLMEEGHKSREDVISYIKLIDERRQKWSQFLYNVNWKDPENYDLIFNLEKINLNTASDLLELVASKKEFQSTPQSMQVLKNLHLAAKAKVYLQQSPRTKGSEVEIEANSDSGLLVVTGICPRVGSRMWENDIKSVLSKVEGIKNIKVQKTIVSHYE